MPTAYSAEHTKKLLVASLKKLMAVKPFNKITISEIVADCVVFANMLNSQRVGGRTRWGTVRPTRPLDGGGRCSR